MKGEDKAIEILLDRIWELKQVGVSMVFIGHTKKKGMTDLVTGMEYEMLTTSMSSRYFNAFKTKLHFLGVAAIDRQIAQEKKKVMGQDKLIGRIEEESRKITFRDDSFSIDSKSRFADIVPEIDLNSDEFIKALTDAIQKEHEKQKGAKSIEETAKQQAVEKEKEIEKVIKERTKINVDRNNELTDIIKLKFGVASNDQKVAIKEIMDTYGISSMKDVDTNPTEALEKIVEILQ